MRGTRLIAPVDDALRNLGNRPVRMLLSIFGIAIGTSVSVALVGLGAVNESQVSEILASARSEYLVAKPGASADGDRTLDPSVAEAVRVTGRVRAATTVAGYGTMDVRRLPPGIGSSHSAVVLQTDDAIVQAAGLGSITGRVFDAGHIARGDHVALVGSGVANRLGLAPGRRPETMFIEGRPYHVIGVFEEAAADAALLFSVLVPPGGTVAGPAPPDTVAFYATAEPDDVAEVAGWLELVLSREVRGRFEVSFDSGLGVAGAQVIDQLAEFSAVLLLLGSAISVLIVATILTAAVTERQSEIAVRRALGTGRAEVAAMFVTEGVALGIIGATVGLIGSLIGLLFYTRQIDVALLLPPSVPPAVLLQGVLVGGLASVAAAWRAARLEPQAVLAKV